MLVGENTNVNMELNRKIHIPMQSNRKKLYMPLYEGVLGYSLGPLAPTFMEAL